jgi:hypothetical protein
MIDPTTQMLTIVAKKDVPKVENAPSLAMEPVPAEATRKTGLLAADYE